jgi:hypothetical protein
MRRPLPLVWLGTGTLVAALALGCQHAGHSCPTCGAGPARTADRGANGAPACSVAAPRAANAASPASPSVAAAPRPAPVEPAAPAADPALPAEVLPAPRIGSAPPGPEGKAGWQVFAVQTARPPRRTFPDVTAHPAFEHAPDYSHLVGTLEYARGAGVWHVRYASVNDDDPYGGSVTLVDPGPMAGFTSGQLVRVEGQLVAPAAPQTRAGYRVRNLRPLLQP